MILTVCDRYKYHHQDYSMLATLTVVNNLFSNRGNEAKIGR